MVLRRPCNTVTEPPTHHKFKMSTELKELKQAYSEVVNKSLEDMAVFHGRAEMEAHKRIVVEKELIKVKKLYGDLLQLKEEISFCPLFDDYERLEQLHGELKEENKIRYGLKDYVAKPPERKYKIVAAKYVLYSKFAIPDDRNIEDAHSYWVKWDKLHVVWTEGQTADIYENGCSEDMDTFKRPDNVFLGYNVVEVHDCDDSDLKNRPFPFKPPPLKIRE